MPHSYAKRCSAFPTLLCGPPFPAGIRREAEAAAGAVDFLLMASLAGGTGSGTGSALLQELADQYPASTLAAVAVAPGRTGRVHTAHMHAHQYQPGSVGGMRCMYLGLCGLLLGA
jgi:hypothetical protein